MEGFKLRQAFDEFLDNNKDKLKYANKGYIQDLRERFQQEQNIEVKIGWIKSRLAHYRRMNNVPINYVSKYYKPSEHPAEMYVQPDKPDEE